MEANLTTILGILAAAIYLIVTIQHYRKKREQDAPSS